MWKVIFSVLLVASAQHVLASEPVPPFHHVPPDVPSAALKLTGKVVLFYDVRCPHCRALHGVVERWLSTLPAPLEGVAVPAWRGEAGLNAARGVLAAEALAPQAARAYVHALYAAVQDAGQAADAWETHRQCAAIAGIDAQQFKAAWRSEAVFEALLQAAQWNDALELTEVPALVIDGRFIVTPANVGGDAQLLLRLANGLISQQVLK